MNKKNKYYLLLVLSVILFLTSYFLFHYFERTSKYHLNVTEIEKRIFELDKTSEILLNDYHSIIRTIPQKNKSENLFKYFKIDVPENFIILIYENDTLKFWTDNSFPAKYYFNEYGKNQILHSENGWYRIKSTVEKQFTIACLYKIKNNFFYENDYLKSTFAAIPGIPSSVVVSTSPILIGKDIKDEKGQYLFSLIPSNNIAAENEHNETPFFLFIIAYILLFIFFNNLIQYLSKKSKNFLKSGIIWLISTVVLSGILVFKIPEYITYSSYFNSIMLSDTLLATSGEILLFSVWLIFTSVRIFDIFPIQKIFSSQKNNADILQISTVLLFISFLFFFFLKTVLLFQNIILYGKVSFDLQNILNPDIQGIISLSGISFLLFGIFSVTDSVITKALQYFSFQKFLVLIFSGIIITGILCIFYLNYCKPTFFAAFWFFTGLIILLRKYKQKYSWIHILALIFIFTIFSEQFIIFYKEKSDEHKEKELIKKLADDTDPIAERFLKEINERIEKDSILLNKISDISENQDLTVYDYLRRKYFYGFWEKYDLEITLCGNTEFYRPENQAENCDGFYNLEIKNFGTKVKDTEFWLMHYNNGKITYFGIIDVPQKNDPRKMSLYITLSEKLTTKTLGYPALLIDKSTKTKSEFKNYSYAKYSNGILAVKFGDFSYELTDRLFRNNNKKEYYKKFNHYKHLVYFGNSGKCIVLSKKQTDLFDRIISFTYLFIFFGILIFILILSNDYSVIFKRFRFDFKNKIRFSMISILLISFILFGFGSVYFAVKQNEKNNNREMKEKVQSVLVELRHKLQYETKLTPEWHSDQYDHLDELLNKFSQVFFSDINLFDLNGKLLATSRSEIFNRGLIGKIMNPVAYKKLVSEGKTEYIQKEHIGKMEFSSVYIPLRNENNKIIAFINLPYFSDNNKIKKNISDVLVTTVNLYLVLFLLTAFLSVLISEQITKPLTLLQDKFKSVQLGKKHQKIIYKKQDEIGALVKEYNLMVEKLEESASKLAESERESAWREMAKQIAHEIKNPLTPMKLSIQLLQKTWNNHSVSKKEFEKRLDNVSKTLIEQIDTLSSIASEFSAFAKMPKARNEEVEIVSKLKNVTSLFSNEKNIEVKIHLNKIQKLYVIADKEQVSRVFINLLKNAVQAIPKTKKGKIDIELKKSNNRAVISIKDNGNGIAEEQKKHLFEPSFTTKTTGSGIGLAIVKNIVTSAGGRITFDSEINKGTIFYIEFITL